LPLLLEYYAIIPPSTSDDNSALVASLAKALSKALKRDTNFGIVSEFRSNASTTSATNPVVVKTRILDWNQQQKALDDIFDAPLEKQYKDLPNVEMPAVFKDVHLFDYQIKGINCMLKQETEKNIPPFY